MKKPWWQSTGIWGGLVAFLATVAGQITHHTVTSADIAQVTDLVSSIVTAVSALVAIYGRVRATQKIS